MQAGMSRWQRSGSTLRILHVACAELSRCRTPLRFQKSSYSASLCCTAAVRFCGNHRPPVCFFFSPLPSMSAGSTSYQTVLCASSAQRLFPQTISSRKCTIDSDGSDICTPRSAYSVASSRTSDASNTSYSSLGNVRILLSQCLEASCCLRCGSARTTRMEWSPECMNDWGSRTGNGGIQTTSGDHDQYSPFFCDVTLVIITRKGIQIRPFFFGRCR
jgi:hypothetical protein